MRIGCIAAFENAAEAAKAGFDYIECPVGSLKPEQPDSAFAAIREAFRASALPTPAFNLFIPAELKIVGPAVDEARLRRYAQTAIERVAEVGGRVIVLGSGPARTIPPGFPRERAEEQFIQFSRFAGGVAQRAGVTIGFESIARGGAVNFIHTFEEAVRVAERVAHPAVKAMADLGQMAPEKEPWRHLSELGGGIPHVHIADTDKKVPGFGSLAWREAFAELRRAGYDGLMSIECRWADLAPVAAQAIRFVRDAWGAAGTHGAAGKEAVR
jgi:sugar phosphate isomerase/epimerase